MASRGGGAMEQLLRGGPAAAPPAMPPAPQGAQPPNPAEGTAQSGYKTPDMGPFECENCIHFQEGDGQKNCNQPDVIADPEVTQVEAEGMCKHFESAGNQSQGDEKKEPEAEEEPDVQHE
jgi:hypothetical protein